jgi:hypothetical protein
VLLVCISAFIAPTLIAQNVTVCIFPAKDARGTNADTPQDVTTLAGDMVALPGAASLNVVPVTGVSPKDIDAEAAHRHCTYAVSLWREDAPPESPNFVGGLGGTKPSPLKAKGVLLEYSLRKADSHKVIAHGESDEDSAYTSFAAAIAKKIGQQK